MSEIDEFQAMYPMVFRYTVPIKQYAESRDDLMGAGVLVDVGDRLFVATARHCIEDQPIVLEDKFSLPARASRITILRRGVHPTLDVGFLEIEPRADVSILQRGRCSLDMLCVQPLTTTNMVHVVGFPEVARRTDDSGL